MYTQQQLLDFLQKQTIPYQLYHHTPLFTCEQALNIIAHLNIPGIGIKNLFLKDDHKKLYLISATYNTKIDLKAFGKAMRLKNIRFADANLLQQHLGVLPGSVTPLALLNDPTQTVQFFIDADIFNHDYMQVHPLQNDATVALQPNDFIQFLKLINRSYTTYNFSSTL